MKMDFAFLTVAEIIRFLLVLTQQNITTFFENKKSYENGSGPCSFMLILGRVGSLH